MMVQIEQAARDETSKWVPKQSLPVKNFILYAYAADRSARPTYVCLPYGLYHAINGRIVARTGTHQEIVALAGIHFFDTWRVKPSCEAPKQLPITNDGPDEPKAASTQPTFKADQTRMREEEAREILERASKITQRMART